MLAAWAMSLATFRGDVGGADRASGGIDSAFAGLEGKAGDALAGNHRAVGRAGALRT